MCDYPNRERAMTVLERDNQGTPTVFCDPCISPLIKALNDGGIKTVASCCGHGKRTGSVVLRDGRCLVITKDLEQHNKIFAQLGLEDQKGE